MGLRTPLYDTHVAAGARTVDFGGWDMPVNYGSQIEEHHAVRRDAGMFDVSHMCVVDLRGDRVRDYLRRLLANDVAKLTQHGKALYSCMLRDDGGVIDDLIVYYMDDRWYRMVVNAGTRDKDLAWLRQQAEGFGVAVEPRFDLAMIAVQGPNARQKAATVIDPATAGRALQLGPFFGLEAGDLFIARTGYTGEDGWEIMLPAERAAGFWQELRDAGVAPCGLGARDTLRLEAGMNLYGNDMDETTSPLESGLGWTIAWEPQDRDFIGRGCARRAEGECEHAQVRRPAGRGTRRTALAPESDRARGRGGRGHQRHLFADAAALDRAGARSGEDRGPVRGGDPRQARASARRPPAVRAQRQGDRRTLIQIQQDIPARTP